MYRLFALIFSLFVIISCNNLESQTKDVPIIIDLDATSMYYTDREESDFSYSPYNRLYYIGEWQDEIEINSLDGIFPPPPPPLPPPPPPPKNLSEDDLLEFKKEIKSKSEETKPVTRNPRLKKYTYTYNNEQEGYRAAGVGDLKIIVDTSQTVLTPRGESYIVMIQNRSTDTLVIGPPFHINYITEEKNTEKEWIPIQEDFSMMCVTSLVNLTSLIFILPPSEIIISTENFIKGEEEKMETLRLNLNGNFSNEFLGVPQELSLDY